MLWLRKVLIVDLDPENRVDHLTSKLVVWGSVPIARSNVDLVGAPDQEGDGEACSPIWTSVL